MNKEIEDWLKDKPSVIKDLVHKYPPGEYIIKENAPYAISCPGTKVTIISYHETNKPETIGVIILPENLLPEANRHIKELKHINNKQHELNDTATPYKVIIDPSYLETINHESN